MPRHPNSNGLSIVQLEKMLEERRSKIGSLERKRSKFQRQLDTLDAQIASLGGSARARGSRPRNKTTLTDAIATVLKKSVGPMKVADIARNALNSGYSTSSSNFRVIVNQALIKDKRFTKAGERGTYQLKK
jgi:septal ring factor EnvC (AmiA/AmiB activator)